MRLSATCLPACVAALAASSLSCRSVPGEKSIADRIAGRDFPSVFQAWNPADNLPGEDRLKTAARHDLIWHGPGFLGLQWDRRPVGLAEGFRPKSIPKALALRKKLLARNPNLILIAEVRYRDAYKGFLPADHPWWRRDRTGEVVKGWAEGKFLQLDFSNPDFRRHVARRAAAVVRSGAFDGVLLDWWKEDWDRLQLVKAVRRAIGDDRLILVNTNDRIENVTAPYVNGWFMECYRTKTPTDWRRIEKAARWAQAHLRTPRLVCVETWFHASREDRHLMRATTTLALTHSDGYCLFSDPNPLPTGDHLHNWYPFWDVRLGRPLGPGITRPDGSVVRPFTNGTVVYNPMGNRAVTVGFAEPRTRAATGRTAKQHTLNAADGDIFLKPEAKASE